MKDLASKIFWGTYTKTFTFYLKFVFNAFFLNLKTKMGGSLFPLSFV